MKVAAAAPGSAVLCRLVTSGRVGLAAVAQVRLLHRRGRAHPGRRGGGLGLEPPGCPSTWARSARPEAWGPPIAAAARVFDELRAEGPAALAARPRRRVSRPARRRRRRRLPAVGRVRRRHRPPPHPGLRADGPGPPPHAGRARPRDRRRGRLLHSRVLAVIDRGGTRWVFLDAGVFTGLVETIEEAIRCPVTTSRDRDGGPRVPCVLAGPTCDSADVLYEQAMVHHRPTSPRATGCGWSPPVPTSCYRPSGSTASRRCRPCCAPEAGRALRPPADARRYAAASLATALPWPLLLRAGLGRVGRSGRQAGGCRPDGPVRPAVLGGRQPGDRVRRDRLVLATLLLRLGLLRASPRPSPPGRCSRRCCWPGSPWRAGCRRTRRRRGRARPRRGPPRARHRRARDDRGVGLDSSGRRSAGCCSCRPRGPGCPRRPSRWRWSRSSSPRGAAAEPAARATRRGLGAVDARVGRPQPAGALALATAGLVNVVGSATALALLPLTREVWGQGDGGYGVATAWLGFGALAAPLLWWLPGSTRAGAWCCSAGRPWWPASPPADHRAAGARARRRRGGRRRELGDPDDPGRRARRAPGGRAGARRQRDGARRLVGSLLAPPLASVGGARLAFVLGAGACLAAAAAAQARRPMRASSRTWREASAGTSSGDLNTLSSYAWSPKPSNAASIASTCRRR